MPGASSFPPPATAAVLPREGARDPDFWLTLSAWLVIAFSCLQILLFAFGRDQGIYAVVADAVLRGEMPYRDAWDFKPPGIFLVFALARGLFGANMFAPRLIEVVGLLLMVLGFMRLGRTFYGLKRVGLVGGALAALVHAELEFWHTSQPETFGGYLTVWALVLTVAEKPASKRWLYWAAVGALFGCAFLLKPPLAGGAMVTVAYLARAEQARRPGREARGILLPLSVVGAGALLPILACGLWFRLSGAFGDLRWTMFDFTPGYTMLSWEGRGAPQTFYWALEELLFKFSALNAAGFLAALLIPPMHGREREGLFLVLGIISVELAGVCMQGKFFPYHYGATLPLVAFIAGVGLYKLWRRCLMGGFAGATVFVLFVAVTAIMRTAARDLDSFWDRSAVRMKYLFRIGPYQARELMDRELAMVADYNLDADRRLADEMRRRTDETAPVFVWGFEPVVYLLAERRPASRFIYNVPQRVQWARDHARGTLMQDLTRRPPQLIAVQRNDVFPSVTGDDLDSRRALETFPELSALIEHDYALVESIEDFELYERLPRDVPHN
jgi:4-amino-4-deoxy-L-arabinose transferase-like glycosyltransferase